MEIQTGQLTTEEAQEIQTTIDKTEFPSRYHFLKDHNGIRRGEVHTLTSPKGSGKSTLVRTIQLDTIRGRKRVLNILSEETVKLYKINIWQALFQATDGDENLTNDLMDNALFCTELDMADEERDPKIFFEKLMQ